MGCGKSTADHTMTAEEKKAQADQRKFNAEHQKQEQAKKKAEEKAQKDAAKKAETDQKAFNAALKKEEDAKKKAEADAAKKAGTDQKAFNEAYKKEQDAKKKAEEEAAKKAGADQKAFNVAHKKEEEKKAKEVINGKKVLPGAKKGPKERPASEFVKAFGSSEGKPDESYVCQDSKSGGLVIVYPLNLHDDYAVDQCEKLLKLKHENVISHTGYFRDEANHFNITAELPLLADLHT